MYLRWASASGSLESCLELQACVTVDYLMCLVTFIAKLSSNAIISFYIRTNWE